MMTFNQDLKRWNGKGYPGSLWTQKGDCGQYLDDCRGLASFDKSRTQDLFTVLSRRLQGDDDVKRKISAFS
jgi:hypothetical protein